MTTGQTNKWDVTKQIILGNMSISSICGCCELKHMLSSDMYFLQNEMKLK